MRTLLALAVAMLLGAVFAPVPLPLPSLGALAAVLSVLAAPERTGRLGLLGLPGYGSPIGRRGP